MPFQVASSLSALENKVIVESAYKQTSLVLQTHQVRKVWEETGRPDIIRGRPSSSGTNMHDYFKDQISVRMSKDVKATT